MDNGFLAQAGMQTMFMRKRAEHFCTGLLCCSANLVDFSAYLTFSQVLVPCLTDETQKSLENVSNHLFSFKLADDRGAEMSGSSPG